MVVSVSLMAWAYTAYVVTASQCVNAPEDASRVGEVIELASVAVGKKITPIVILTAEELEIEAVGGHVTDSDDSDDTFRQVTLERRCAVATPLERDDSSRVWVVPVLCHHHCTFADWAPGPLLSYPF